MKKWDDPKYQIIKNIKFENNFLTVYFEDGSSPTIHIKNLLPMNTQQINTDQINFNSYEIVIPTNQGNIEIPSTKIRVITDDEFSSHMVKIAEIQAKKIGRRIRQLRQNRNFKSKDLAERTGLTPQSISRIESGKQDVVFTTLQKILFAMGYDLKDLIEEEFEAEKKSLSILLKKISRCGIERYFVLTRIIPNWIQEALTEAKDEPEMLLDEAAKAVGDIFGWSVSEIWNKEFLSIDLRPAMGAYFKTPANINEKKLFAYSVYAYSIAKLVLRSTTNVQKIDYPENTEELRSELYSYDIKFNLEKILSYIWKLGICVIPLDDPGIFHGASWNITGRHVIVLKHRTKSHAQWIYDLLHEFYHVLAHLEKEDTGIIENEEISPFSGKEMDEEREANSFANHLIFNGRAEELAQMCVKFAMGKMELLKNAVITIAKQENVGKDFLANYIGYRLSQQGQNWWGTANNLQIEHPLPFNIVREFLIDHIDFNKLSDFEQGLIKRAIN